MASSSLCGRARRTLVSDVSSFRNAVSKLCNSKSSSSSSMSLLVSIGDGRSSRLLGFAASSPKLSSSTSCFSPFTTNSRVAAELGCAGSLMPLHSATASALFTSMLSLHSQSWGCLSEGFATPL